MDIFLFLKDLTRRETSDTHHLRCTYDILSTLTQSYSNIDYAYSGSLLFDVDGYVSRTAASINW